MAHKVIDRCKETTSTPGTGNLTLTGAASGFVTMASVLTSNGDTSWFCAENGSEWEVFLGTRVSATELARSLISSSTGSTINFTSPPVVFSTVPAAQFAPPAFSAYRDTSNQSLTSGTAAKVQLNAEEFDTADCFDPTTNFRFTPNVAGYYKVSGFVATVGTSVTAGFASVYKNGSEYKRGAQLNLSYGNASNQDFGVSALVYLNGSTDYVELWVLVIGTSPAVVYGSAFTYFSGNYVRGA